MPKKRELLMSSSILAGVCGGAIFFACRYLFKLGNLVSSLIGIACFVIGWLVFVPRKARRLALREAGIDPLAYERFLASGRERLDFLSALVERPQSRPVREPAGRIYNLARRAWEDVRWNPRDLLKVEPFLAGHLDSVITLLQRYGGLAGGDDPKDRETRFSLEKALQTVQDCYQRVVKGLAADEDAVMDRESDLLKRAFSLLSGGQ